VVNIAPPPAVPPTIIFRTDDGELVPRKDQPVTLVDYDKAEDLFKKEEPTLRKMMVNKEGGLDINFSNDMAFPDEWSSKLESDTRTLQQEREGTLVGRRRL